jgi:hypothetical protein
VQSQQVTLRADLQPIPLNHSIVVNLDQAAYADAGARMSSVPFSSAGGEIQVTPFPYGGQPMRLPLARGAFGSPAELDYGDLVPGLPNELYIGYSALLQFAPDVTGEALLSSELPVDAGTDPIAPGIWPVQNVTINGADATVPQNGVGPLPVLRWSVPPVGSPAEYRVTLFRVDSGGWIVWSFPLYTTDPEFVLPPGAITPGHSYAAMITAIASSSRRQELPLMKTLPEYRAQFVTAPFTP